MTPNPPRPPARVAILGAGPSGLVTLKTLLEWNQRHPSDFPLDAPTVFEAESDIGGTFRYRAGYEDAHLVSSKQLTAFGDFRLPRQSPDHLDVPTYLRYLEDYVEHFGLRQSATWRMGTRVTSVRRELGPDGRPGHRVSWRRQAKADDDDDAHAEQEETGSQWFSHVAVCAGLHVEPGYPTDIPGLAPPSELCDEEKRAELQASLSEEQRRIQTFHSSSFKKRSTFKGKRVMILGTGETGMDLGKAAVKGGATEIVMCTRRGFLHIPAVLERFVLFGSSIDRKLPIDTLITMLFEADKVHPWVARSRLRWFVSDWVISRFVLPFMTGTSAGLDQWVGELPREQKGRAYTHLCKSSGAMPYLNKERRKRSRFMEAVAHYAAPDDYSDSEPGITLAPFPVRVEEDGSVVFSRARPEYEAVKHLRFKPDVVAYATGYKHSFPFLDETYPTAAQASCRGIFRHNDPSVAFIGYLRPGVGAIPPMAELSAMLWSMVIGGQLEPPTSEPHYALLVPEGARVQHGVDYSSFQATLAKDMGATPSLRGLVRTYGVRVLFIYCFGAAFSSFYRLLGPWQTPGAVETVRGEIGETIARRGLLGNVFMGLIPMVFYAAINAVAWTLEQSLHALESVTPRGAREAVARGLGLPAPREATKAKVGGGGGGGGVVVGGGVGRGAGEKARPMR